MEPLFTKPSALIYLSAATAALFVFSAAITRQRNLPRWCFALGMLAIAGEQFLAAQAIKADDPLELAKLLKLRFVATAVLPGIWLLFAASYSRGERALSNFQKFLILAPAFAIPLFLALWAAEYTAIVSRDSEIPFRWQFSLGWSGFLIHVTLLVAMVGAMVGLERSYRASVGALRWKIKFMLYGLGLLFACRFYTSSQTILNQEIDPALDIVNAAAVILACALTGRSMTRQGTFEIDLYPSKSIISGSLTITLAGIYLIVVGVVSNAFVWLGGERATPFNTFFMLLAIVLLGLLLQSDRVRMRLSRFVSRHFQRPLFDYRTVWQQVSQATSSQVRSQEIADSALRLLSQLFEAKLVGIWLSDSRFERFELVASSDQPTRKMIFSPKLAKALAKAPEPFDLESAKEDWAADIKESNPRSFNEGGSRACIPLVARGKTLGFIALGERSGAARYSQQDLDTLACIADQISGSLLNAELTSKLEESKEIEAFQAMATFFVHDLKNAVSTLNLMLKNMPLYWDNPEFREDALKGIGRTSERINHLIARLGKVRSGVEIEPAAIDLETLIDAALSDWHRPASVSLSKLLKEPHARVLADRSKIKSVLLNLLINAVEAMDESGSIEISSWTSEAFATITVSDNGQGMSEDFVRNSLFRPFKTTKKSGLGIGMFQSKTIVEAHGGSVTVDSASGLGTSISITLPLSAR